MTETVDMVRCAHCLKLAPKAECEDLVRNGKPIEYFHATCWPLYLNAVRDAGRVRRSYLRRK